MEAAKRRDRTAGGPVQQLIAVKNLDDRAFRMRQVLSALGNRVDQVLRIQPRGNDVLMCSEDSLQELRFVKPPRLSAPRCQA